MVAGPVAGVKVFRRRRPSLRVRLWLAGGAALLLAAAVWTGTHGEDSPGPLFVMGLATAAAAWWAHRHR